jgi:hypothetical protein
MAHLSSEIPSCLGPFSMFCLGKKKKKKSLLCLPTYRVEVRNWNRLKGLTIDGTGSMDLDRSGASIWELGGWREFKKIKNKK